MLKYPGAEDSKNASVITATKTLQNKRSGELRNKTKSTAKISSETKTCKSYQLYWNEILCLSFCWETPLLHLIELVNLVVDYGGMSFLLGYFAFSMFVGMPILMSLLFLGNYTKTSYFKMWEMVPLLKAAILPVCLLTLMMEVFNISLAALALSYATNSFRRRIPWMDCAFHGATSKCYIAHLNRTYDKDCSSNKTVNSLHFPAYEYFLTVINPPELQKIYELKIGSSHTSWIISDFISWLIICLFLLASFQKVRSLMSCLVAMFGFLYLIPTLWLTFAKSVTPSRPVFMENKFHMYFTPGFWLAIFTHSLTRKIPSNYFFLGRHLPLNMKPDQYVFCVCGMKYVYFIFIMVWLSTTIRLAQMHYSVEDIKCIPVSGLYAIFGIIPDIMEKFYAKRLVLLFYFLGLWYLAVFSTTCTLHAFCESTMEAFPRTANLEVPFKVFVCLGCFLFSMIFTTNLYFTIMETWLKHGLPFLTAFVLLLYTLALVIYSKQKLENDFYFVYGRSVNAYWLETLSFAFIIALLAFCLCPFIQQSHVHSTSFLVNLWCYLTTGVCIIFVVAVAAYLYIKHKSKGTHIQLIVSSSEWGPSSKAEKLMRSKFNPKRESKYVNEVHKCHHNCLINSEQLQKEVKMLEDHQQKLIASITKDDD